MMPLPIPSAVPTSRLTASASTPRPNAFKALTVMAPVSSTIAPTDKSMLPIRMTNDAPRQASRSVLAWPRMPVMLRRLKNASDISEKKTIRTATTAIGSHTPLTNCRSALGTASGDAVSRSLTPLVAETLP